LGFALLFLLLSDILVFLIYPFYLCVLVIDLVFLIIKYQEKGILRPIIAGIVVNVILLTLGQYIMTFVLMDFM
jgi:hypothetical protein